MGAFGRNKGELWTLV